MNRRQKISKRPLPPKKLPTECLSCGEHNPWVINKVAFSAPFRSTTHEIFAEAHQCRHCDAITTSTEQTAAISEKVREAHRKWLAEKFKKLQKQCGLTLRDMELKTGISFATLGRISSAGELVDLRTEERMFHELEDLLRTQRENMLLDMHVDTVAHKDQFTTVHIKTFKTKMYDILLDRAAKSPSADCFDGLQNGLSQKLTDLEPIPA